MECSGRASGREGRGDAGWRLESGLRGEGGGVQVLQGGGGGAVGQRVGRRFPRYSRNGETPLPSGELK